VWTQRDQIQAYQFLRRRLVSALVAADANHPTSPSRRLILTTVLGVAAAVLTAGVFGILGLLNPSSSANWRQGGQVIVEQSTGARYILGKDGKLYPVLNYASARLLAQGDGSATANVSAAALSSVSRGPMLGIAGAPDSLPAPTTMTDHVFTSCSRTSASQPAGAAPTSTLILGSSTAGQQALGTGQGLVVSARPSQSFLIADGFRFRIADNATLTALHYDTVAPIAVAPNWLDAVPAAPDLGLVDITGSGAPGPDVGGQSTRVGQVLTDGEYYVVRSDGLEPISQTEAYLITGDQHNANAYPTNLPAPVPTSVAAIGATPRAGQTGTAGYPTTLPRLRGVGANPVLCATGDGTDTTTITVGAALPLPSGAAPITTSGGTGQLADEVYVPPGSGALLRVRTGLTTSTGATYLVTDTGLKYLVPTPAAVAALGYGSVTPVSVSEPLLALLPTGPALDPDKAGIPVNEGGTG
jgi:type VII secretion protein EccB